MLAHSLFFYFFSTIAVFSALMVTISKNTVYSVFFLILVFVSTSVLFIMIGAEFLGMIMLIVYVGAVAVLFLFVVMMLNVSLAEVKKGFSTHLPIGLLVSLIVFLEILVVIGGWKYKSDLVTTSSIVSNQKITNTEAIGNLLYTDYIYLFQISGMILLVAMVGAIVLTFRKRKGIKRQNVFDQISKERADSVFLADVETGKGVKIDD